MYEGGNKRYNDELFLFDGHNGAIVLENGGGKTVFIQTAIQAILPHADLANRKIKDTLKLEDGPAHIAIEWILNDYPRRYALTCVSLFLTKNGLDSYRYVFEYGEHDKNSIENVPFVKPFSGKVRAADRGEIQEYYSDMAQHHMNAKIFDTIKSYKSYVEKNYHIIAKEWESIVKINSAEGDVEHFFDECKTTGQLFDRLFIPTVEESMAGFQKDEFAQTFEKHRNSFKEYKQLKGKIAENEQIKERVELYVQTFEGLDEKSKHYQEIKEIAKAYLNLVKKQQNKTNEEQEQLNEAFKALEEKQKKLEQKNASYEIALEKEKLEAVSKKLAEEVEAQVHIQETFEQTESFYYSLKLAQYKKNYEMEEQTRSINQEKLKDFDKEFDTEEIRIHIEENDRKIKGYFAALEEKLQKEQQELQFECNSVQHSLESEKEAFEKTKVEQRKFLNLEASKKALIDKNNQEMKEIESEVLSNPKQEKIEEQLKHWIQSVNTLDEENINLVNRNKELHQENDELTKKLEDIKEQLTDAYKKETELRTKKEKYDEEHQKLKWTLSEKKMSWARLESVYLKQDSIEKQVIEEINKLTNERNTLLDQERLAFRFVDDYGKQTIFHADPFLSTQMEQWKNQFSYIETGVSYIQSLPESVDQLMEEYPLWPITLITTSKEKLKVQEKVKSVYDRLQYPVHVLSMDEATAIIRKEYPIYSQWIAPKHWESNRDAELFADWKETIRQSAEEVKQNRLAKETELQSWHQLEKAIHDFFQQYPYAEYQDMADQLSMIQEQIFQLDGEEKQRKENLALNQREYNINQNKQSENKEAINGYGIKIEKGRKYEKKKKENEELKTEIVYLANKLQEMDRLALKQQRAVEGFQTRVDELKQEIRDLSSRISTSIYEDRLYQKVKDLSPIYTSNMIEVLENKRQDLQLELEHLSKGRSELEAAVQNASNNMERLQHEMDQLRKEKSHVNEELHFPLNGTEKMNELWTKYKELETSLKRVTEQVGQLTTEHDKLVGSVENMMKNVAQFIPFDTHLEMVRKQLDDEALSIHTENEQLEQWSKQLENQLQNINMTVIELEKYDVKHLFLDQSIKEAVLSSEEVTEFTYSRWKKAKEIVRELEIRSEAWKKEREKVDRAKVDYIEFCRQYITDIRMRETAIQGIEHKQTYPDILTYKELLEKRIQTAIKYAEQNIITHDQELEQFIVHIHMHLKKIADELRLIPKRTSVKVENQWKEIFTFQIPDWDEQEGKADIRSYIHWILDQLDKEGYKDENGFDDAGKINKDLEKWLQSKQLLQVVMKNKTMKVTCRKVTNDNKVTKGTYSWEQSNVWSGGEKWSKNMTLFLGILNYIAEKQAAIQSKMKRHRTVIVDNPFGKASSDHVLNPVFFIAEQLGFQIIALTAHAEGKFLRDYFPVIYSLRLRNATGNDKQIMTKERTIKHAYFKDHDPKALERLGEVEQLEL